MWNRINNAWIWEILPALVGTAVLLLLCVIMLGWVL